jgi:hypothetical protein
MISRINIAGGIELCLLTKNTAWNEKLSYARTSYVNLFICVNPSVRLRSLLAITY